MSRHNFDAWVRSRFVVRNETGGRGYDHGVRIFDCGLCDDASVGGGRGWVNVERGTSGCFNSGCPAEGGMNAVEYIRRVEGFRTRTETLIFLRREFPATGLPSLPPNPPSAYDDWCRLPAEFRPITNGGRNFRPQARGSHLLDEAVAFARRQWGVGPNVLARWGCGYCAAGRHAWRLVIPVTMGGRLVAFQSRSYRGGAPKYRTSQHGGREEPGAECGRPAEAILFNLDSVTEGSDVVLVEGAGDAMVWSGRSDTEMGGRFRTVVGEGETSGVVAVALLGVSLTDEKAALLAAQRPGRVIVALDAEPEAEMRARRHIEALWFGKGLRTVLGRWVGAKDAGGGASLEIDSQARDLAHVVADRRR